MMKLSQENYYDVSPLEYMSASTFKQMYQNEAAFIASLAGEYELFTDSTALLVGNYLHSYFESPEAHAAFIKEHPEIISSRGSSKGQLKTSFAKAEQMIKRIEDDAVIVNLIERAKAHEVIIQGKIDDVLWKGKVDALNVKEGYFLDYKTVRTLKDDGAEWVDMPDGERIRYDNFIEARMYHVQMFVYKTLLEQMYGKKFMPIIVAVSKEDEPIADLYGLSDDVLEGGKVLVETYQNRFVDVLNGKESPKIVADHSRFYNSRYRVSEVKIV
ncbi:phage-related protein [Weissella oryzae SG25]|uniref:Phage-related protein n=1 Tax=Weissella oryzae (strain DSM 25784 / JCM 18191 / LMG 30913 / SG25) TaxID=1329250 RepID=A0A069CWL0_WEIOS|nr:PD-(D/E)XK nuclease-like domain-containing protein [Weissella oryzae]GAK31824.1 phage-related protein [Weissella oryzae SG25]